MTVEEAEDVLSKLEPKELQKVISRLANRTPKVAYYPNTFMKDFQLAEQNAEGRSMVMRSLLVLTFALRDMIEPGHDAELTLNGVYHGDTPAGNWHVRVTRLPDQLN